MRMTSLRRWQPVSRPRPRRASSPATTPRTSHSPARSFRIAAVSTAASTATPGPVTGLSTSLPVATSRRVSAPLGLNRERRSLDTTRFRPPGLRCSASVNSISTDSSGSSVTMPDNALISGRARRMPIAYTAVCIDCAPLPRCPRPICSAICSRRRVSRPWSSTNMPRVAWANCRSHTRGQRSGLRARRIPIAPAASSRRTNGRHPPGRIDRASPAVK